MYISVNTIWVLLGAILVFFMQAGFAMVETGFTRAKNAGNIMMKNFSDFCIGSILFFILGFGVMFGNGNGFVGGVHFFLSGDYMSVTPEGVPFLAFVIFQTVFCGTAATIVSGAVVGRIKFSGYMIISAIISGIVYPVSGHWIWGGGWLEEMGFHDFAGSTAVHLVGGMAAAVAAIIIGPRIGKYSKEGKSTPLAGHSVTLGALGVFILWLGWFGFNGCSTVSMTGDNVLEKAAHIFMTTNLSAVAACLAAMFFTWFRYGKPDVSMSLNGVLAGLVAITAGCDTVGLLGALIIGAIAGITVVVSIEFIDRKCKIDDPVGAVSVHGVCGALGTILTGIFAMEGGLLYGGGLKMLLVQILGVFVVIMWVVLVVGILSYVLHKTIGLRVEPSEEMAGLDVSEHGLQSAYPDFVFAAPFSGYTPELISGDVPVNEAIPVEIAKNTEKIPLSDVKIAKVEIITKPQRFEALKVAMNEIGVTGMTVTQVIGFGMQKGITEYYRGIEMNSQLLPKIKVEIIVAKVPVEAVVNTAKKVLYTGHIGDGKIFIYNVENVLRVRTGEYGYSAMQGVDE